MKGIVLAAVIGSARQLLAIVVALLAIAGAAYFGTHEVGFPVHQAACYSAPRISQTPSCRQPTSAAWQIPLAIVLTVLGLGAAVAVRAGVPGAKLTTGRRLEAQPQDQEPVPTAAAYS
jgi:hypothetical protein